MNKEALIKQYRRCRASKDFVGAGKSKAELKLKYNYDVTKTDELFGGGFGDIFGDIFGKGGA